MAATPCHDQDSSDESIQEILDATEFRIYGKDGGVATDKRIFSVLVDGFNQPRNSALAHDVLMTDRWNLRGSMVALADRLGTDHGTISRWYHQGILPSSIEQYLLASPARPDDWEAPIHKLLNARHRSAFMAVAGYLYKKLPGQLVSERCTLSIVDTELLFEILHLDDRRRWNGARSAGNLSVVTEIVRSVCNAADRELTPFWLTNKQKSAAEGAIAQLLGNDHLAFEYLCALQDRWEGVFTLTRSAVEGMGWFF